MAVAQVETTPQQQQQQSSGGGGEERAGGGEIEKTRALICALNFLSRNLPLPQHVFEAVSSIYHEEDGDAAADAAPEEDNDGAGREVNNQNDSSNVVGGDDMMAEFEVAVLNQRQTNCLSGSELAELRENRFQSHIHRRLIELEELPASRGEDLQSKCLIEFYGLKLADLQRKIRTEVSAEYWLRLQCTNPENQLFDWGMMRLRLPSYGIVDAFVTDAEDPLKKKRGRFEEEKKAALGKFFADLMNTFSELQLQVQGAQRRRKKRNDGVQAWHGKQRQKALKAEQKRMQALKNDNQEAYNKMVEESKNERLTELLEKTNEILGNLGAFIRLQKEKNADNEGIQLKGSDVGLPELSASKGETQSDGHVVKKGDLLEGQRQYNSAVHSIEEKVTKQPAMLVGGELRSYQLEGLQWMLSLFNNSLNGILADEMGLGKTVQTISLIAYLMENKGVAGPHLIVAPKAVLPNWMNEFATWAPSIVAVLYDGRRDARKAIREQYFGEGKKFHVMITHYDLIMRDKTYLRKIQWYYTVIDEGHRLKNHDSVLVQTIVNGYHTRRRLLLTGTPIQNSLQELWSLLNFLLPDIFNSVDNFEKWFNSPFMDKKNSTVTLTEEEQLLIIRRLHQVIRPFILRRKKNEVEKCLPGKTRVVLKCDMSAWQRIYYQQVTDKGRVGLDNGKGKSLQNLTMQLRKCCNHPYLFLDSNDRPKGEEIFRASGKFELLDRLLPKLRRAGHRVLLFSQMTHLMDILGAYLEMQGYKFLRLDGSTNTEERGDLLRKFNAPDSPHFIFLLSTRAGGLGLNLQTADSVIMFDSDWNPQMDQQAEDRAHRIGQKSEVRVFVLVSAGTIEEVILERAKKKDGDRCQSYSSWIVQHNFHSSR
ncbi:OLC1v1008336C1 [Oldenlandia corymbosa var. corymbosa]|uniref:OLC1v1008336C1 n=1 Tax=Oldenlandia corymbosa var. corymbosa TaxID=529605 RepID=A0AAV1DNU6_OLDCO|nr:OLC1v1008336C1 [Oldenlandia corymbosa var. corymbosa]